MTREESAVLCKLAYAQHPSIEVTRELLESYHLGLGDNCYHEALRALKAVLSEPMRKYPPTTGEINEQIAKARGVIPGGSRPERASIAAPKYPDTPAETKQEIISRMRLAYPELWK